MAMQDINSLMPSRTHFVLFALLAAVLGCAKGSDAGISQKHVEITVEGKSSHEESPKDEPGLLTLKQLTDVTFKGDVLEYEIPELKMVAFSTLLKSDLIREIVWYGGKLKLELIYGRLVEEREYSEEELAVHVDSVTPRKFKRGDEVTIKIISYSSGN